MPLWYIMYIMMTAWAPSEAYCLQTPCCEYIMMTAWASSEAHSLQTPCYEYIMMIAWASSEAYSLPQYAKDRNGLERNLSPRTQYPEPSSIVSETIVTQSAYISHPHYTHVVMKARSNMWPMWLRLAITSATYYELIEMNMLA